MALSHRICLAVPLVSLLAASTLWTAGAANETTQVVRCTATTGEIVIEVHPEWAPLGAARFLELVKDGFFTNSPLFRVVPGFLVQFGIGETPEVTAKWKSKGKIKDDPNIGIPVHRGTLAFAGSGTDSRLAEMWIAFKDSKHLGKAAWETPFGQVVQGMEAVDKFYSGYGDIKAFKGNAPEQGRLYKEGIAYTKKEFPELSYINSCQLDHAPPLSHTANAAGAGAAEKGSRKEEAGKGAVDDPKKAPVQAEAVASVMAQHPEEDLQKLANSLSAPPAPQGKPSSVLSSTNSILLASAVVALVVGCVRFGGDGIINRAGGGGILDKDR